MNYNIADIVGVFQKLAAGMDPVPNLHIVCKTVQFLEQAEIELSKLGVLDNISVISSNSYVTEVEIKLNANNASDITETDGDEISGWGLLSTLCFCAYSHSNQTVYIGYPYIANSGIEETESVEKMEFTETLPLERAIRHELGHYKQHKEFGEDYLSINKIILEYHNIIFNENESNFLFGVGSTMGKEKYRITYNDKVLFGKSPLSHLNEGTIKIDEIICTDNNEINACVINNENLEHIADRIGINQFDHELYKRISSKLKDNTGDIYIQFLFVNMLNELEFIN